jgi:hypothetical protein
MTTYEGIALNLAGSPDPAYPRLGSAPLDVHAADWAATWDGQGPQTEGLRLPLNAAADVARHDPHGPQAEGFLVAAVKAQLAGTWDGQGPRLIGRFIPISAIYRNADRLTLSGIAVDLASQPLRSVQLQFIGETVAQNYFGSSTDTNGIYIAYLETGDTYTAYAYHTATGTVWRLESTHKEPNTTTLVFRQVTRLGGFGEGLFLKGGT